ncbi:GNAT family N-acetyltransferase [Oceanobacillus damuensis]|uniref:GNAT family N-acetyltransferase n=1 Tax=Oceanobacillus damuensis TaxID=937928 RepID=UPI000830A5DA|nr:GNAT family N-acetyltransferase [Oceanobacillus damuensis]
MYIRKATMNDAYDIAKVHVDSWRTTYKGILPDDFLEQLSYEKRNKLWEKNLDEQNVYVAEDAEGKIVGFSTGGIKKTSNYDKYAGELYAIYILEEFQGKGVGKLLMQPIVQDMVASDINSMIVLVLEDNPSKNFYENLGGRKIETLEVTIAGVVVNELVYGWKDLNQSFLDRGNE